MTMTTEVRSAIDHVRDLHEHHIAHLRADPRPKVGYVSIQTPEELLIAAGMVPFRLTGTQGNRFEDASARLSGNYCSYVLGCFSEGLSGTYDFADGVVFSDTCDMRKRLSENWERSVPGSKAYFLEHPSDDSPLAKSFFAAQLRKLATTLEERLGRPITDDDLWRAIDLCNHTRDLMQRLYKTQKWTRPILGGQDTIDIVKAAGTGLKETFNDRMDGLLALIEEDEEPDPVRHDRQRVMVCGSHFDQPEIISAIEASEADLVCEEVSTGRKYFEGGINTAGDPYQAMAEYYLGRYKTARSINTDARAENLIALSKEYKVDSVLYCALKFCDTNLHDYPYIKKKLKAAGLRVLFIESEHRAENIENLKTRIQTFLEPQFV